MQTHFQLIFPRAFFSMVAFVFQKKLSCLYGKLKARMKGKEIKVESFSPQKYIYLCVIFKFIKKHVVFSKIIKFKTNFTKKNLFNFHQITVQSQIIPHIID